MLLASVITIVSASSFSPPESSYPNDAPGNYNNLLLCTMYTATACLHDKPGSGVGPNCNSSYPYNAKEIAGLANLKQNWISTRGSDDTFYKHEWEKHGTCSTDLLKTQKSYFEKTIQLHTQLNLAGILKGRGIVPGTKVYQKTAVAAALKAGLGVEVLLECQSIGGKSYLSGVNVLYAHKSTFPKINPSADYVRAYAGKCPASFMLPTIPSSCYR
ncbi:putative ribonuclease T2 [Blattamonas nauphoetae]|uniref:Ribonuclease T2 n=1 Tax=Blattamonas nauphoetae TaxID=2049346 RepID=A0ABQ9XUD1_9EUKA|nr:putative ribonuclease T2 [Blattamonas nauphoetae]